MKTPWFIKAKAAMADQKVTLADLADLLDMTPGGVSHYLNGRRKPAIEQVQKIAGRLGMSVSELCSEDAYFIIDDQERRVIDLLRLVPDESLDTAIRLLTALVEPELNKTKN